MNEHIQDFSVRQNSEPQNHTETPAFLVLTGNSPGDGLKALRQFIFQHDNAVYSQNITLQSCCLLLSMKKDQRARGSRSSTAWNQESSCPQELLSVSCPFPLLFCCHLSLKVSKIWSCYSVNQETQKVKVGPTCWILAPGTPDGKARPKTEGKGDSFLRNVNACCLPNS